MGLIEVNTGERRIRVWGDRSQEWRGVISQYDFEASIPFNTKSWQSCSKKVNL